MRHDCEYYLNPESGKCDCCSDIGDAVEQATKETALQLVAMREAMEIIYKKSGKGKFIAETAKRALSTPPPTLVEQMEKKLHESPYEYHEHDCIYCSQLIERYVANPSKWEIFLPNPATPGKWQYAHVGCHWEYIKKMEKKMKVAGKMKEALENFGHGCGCPCCYVSESKAKEIKALWNTANEVRP